MASTATRLAVTAVLGFAAVLTLVTYGIPLFIAFFIVFAMNTIIPAVAVVLLFLGHILVIAIPILLIIGVLWIIWKLAQNQQNP